MVGLPRGGRAARASGCGLRRASPSATRACARSPVTEPPKPVVLIVIDGLTPSMLEATDTPALRFLLDHGSYRRAVSTFPSLTPVCLASIATGAHPDVHGIPHLVWWNRERAAPRRVRLVVRRAARVRARRRASATRSSTSTSATLAQRRDGLRGARGRGADDRGDQHHDLPRPAPPPLADPGLPAGATGRSGSSSTASTSPTGRARRSPGRNRAARLDRRLRRRDRPLARHARRLRPARLLPPGLRLRLARARPGRGARGALAAPTPRSPRCSTRPAGPTSSSTATRVVLCSDHGQSHVEQVGAPRRSRALSSPPRTAPRCSTATIRGALAEALDGEPSVDVALFLEDGEVVARRDGDEDLALLDEYPDGRARAEAALRNPNAGEVLVSAAPGWEFVDLAGHAPRRRRQPRRARGRATPRCRC